MIGCSDALAWAVACLFGRVVAAADVAALEADAQVQPAAAGGQAVLAAGDGLGQLEDLDVVEVRAVGMASGLSVRVG